MDRHYARLILNIVIPVAEILLLCLLVYANRKRWIAGPIASFLVAALLSDKDKDSDD